MIVQAYWERKPNGYPPPRCQVEKIVELPGETFDAFLSAPLKDWAFLEENQEAMWSESSMTHCLLVLGEDRNDGLLVDAEGYGYAKYAAYLFGARDIVNAEVQQAVERIVQKGVENTSEGSWCFYYSELYEQMGLVVTPDNGLGGMLLEALRRRPEVAEVEMTAECFDAVYYLDYCKNLSIQPEACSLTREQIGLKCLEFLAEHDGSEELYQMLHNELGLRNREIEELGFDLAHRFEEEGPGMTGPKM